MADPKSAPVPPPSAYINAMQVKHTEGEFFLTFAQRSPQNPGMAHLVSQMVTSPAHAKAMLRALQENIQKYEERFGPIPERPVETPQRIQ